MWCWYTVTHLLSLSIECKDIDNIGYSLGFYKVWGKVDRITYWLQPSCKSKHVWLYYWIFWCTLVTKKHLYFYWGHKSIYHLVLNNRKTHITCMNDMRVNKWHLLFQLNSVVHSLYLKLHYILNLYWDLSFVYLNAKLKAICHTICSFWCSAQNAGHLEHRALSTTHKHMPTQARMDKYIRTKFM